jgi:YVTN family beta-propeller protein
MSDSVDGGEGTRSQARDLRFEMLGPLRVVRDGCTLDLGGAQQRAVLAVLLLESDPPVSVTRLAAALWGDRPPPGGTATIQTYVFHLREALEPDRARGARARVLVTQRGGYRLETDGAVVDASEFEMLARAGIDGVRDGTYEQALGQLDTALGLWRGDVLADLAELEAVAPVAARLTELRLSAIEARIDALLGLGRHELVVGGLDELIALHPLRERLHAQRMLALYRCGRQADALAAYRHARRILREEIGVDPSPPLRELHAAILAHDPSLRADVPAPAPIRPAATRFQAASDAARPLRRRRWMLAGTTAACVLVAAVATAAAGGSKPSTTVSALAPNSVGIIDPDGRLHDSARVGPNPTAVAVTANAVWVANGGADSVSRIDSRTHAVIDEVPVGNDPVALTATASDVWVVNGADGTVDRINTVVNRAVGDPIKVGNQPLAIGSGPSGVWVANTGDDTVQRIDPYSGKVGTPIPVGGRPDGIAVDNDSVWVANQLDGTVSRIDSRTGAVHPPVRVGAGPAGLAVVGESLWVANALEQSVSAIDLPSLAVRTITGVGDGPNALVSDGRYVWVGAAHSGAVARIDPGSRAVRRFRTGGSPVAMAVGDHAVYVASRTFTSTAHVGGTLTVGEIYLPGTSTSIDPANVYYFWTIAPERFVYDGLVRYALVDGLAGFTLLVPDLAARMPTVSADGRTYTFDLRTGIRYSTGRTVTASDFARGFRRVFTVDASVGNPALLRGVVGADACLAHPARCDLSQGVIADDAHHRLTIHLTAPDADFLGRLTYFVYPAPPGTRSTQLTTPLPATGPYKIAGVHHRHDKSGTTETTFDTLVRNPYFRQWSFAAQPAGYPDVMRWRAFRNSQDAIKAVLDGQLDIGGHRFLGDSSGLAPMLADLRLHHPERLHAQSQPTSAWIELNTQVAPFNNPVARRAVNFAVDHRKLTDDEFGPGLTEPSCQLLPPNFPAYEPYCPYTRSGPATYNGPDLAKARRLVAQSGTRGARVAIYYEVTTPNDRAVLHDLVAALGSIGYRVTAHAVPCESFGTCLPFGPRPKVQIGGPDGWIPDYTSPDSFYDNLVTCRARNWTRSGFCDPRIDRLAALARRTALTDPAAARTLWTHLDHLVTDAAPWIMLGSDTAYQFTSARVGNYQQTFYGPIYSQLWVT